MSKKPNDNGRKSDGTFAPGNSAGGRTKGSRNKTTPAVEKLLDGEAEELTRVAVSKAKEGDMTALRLCLERIAPARKDSPVQFELPPVTSVSDAVSASSSVLASVAAGDLTPDEAGRIMGLLTAHKSLVELCDIEARIARLEEAKA